MIPFFRSIQLGGLMHFKIHCLSTLALVCSDPIYLQWSYLRANLAPAHSLICTCLACSDPVHSQFRSCLKRTQARLTEKPVLHGLHSNLQPVLTSTDNVAVPATADNTPAHSWTRFPMLTTFLPLLMAFQLTAELVSSTNYIPAFADDPNLSVYLYDQLGWDYTDVMHQYVSPQTMDLLSEATLTYPKLTKCCINRDIDHPAFATDLSTSLTIFSYVCDLPNSLVLDRWHLPDDCWLTPATLTDIRVQPHRPTYESSHTYSIHMSQATQISDMSMADIWIATQTPVTSSVYTNPIWLPTLLWFYIH